MSSTIYNKAFAVELSHDFYVYLGSAVDNQFKVNTDFEIFPTLESQALMSSGRMRFARTPKGLIVFYQAYVDGAGAQQPLVKVNDNSEFVFGVRLVSGAIPQFTTITNLNVNSQTYGSGKILMLQKTAGSGSNPLTQALDASLINMLRPPVFSYNFQPSPPSVLNADVVINNGTVDVLTITNVPYNAQTNSYNVEIDISGQPKGYYTLKAYETSTTNLINSTNFYVDADLLSQNVFGIMKVKFDVANRLYDTTAVNGSKNFRTFTYDFAARSTIWRYYVIPQTVDTSLFDIAVIDGDGAHTFTPVNPATPPYGIPTTLMKINGLNPVILESSVAIPFSEKTLSKLAVWKTDGTASQVISEISNANINGVDSDQLGAAQTIPTITPNISEIFVIV